MPLPHAPRAPQGCVAALPGAARAPLSRARHATGKRDQDGLATAAGLQPARCIPEPRTGSVA